MIKMKLKNLTNEEIETMSFDDLAYAILKEKGKQMKIADLFKEICNMQNLGEKVYEEQIAEFFTLLTTEKRFIQLEKGFWDLRENHTPKIEIEEIEDEEDEEENMDIEEDIEEDEMFIDETKDADDDEADDDLKDLVVLDEENEVDL